MPALTYAVSNFVAFNRIRASDFNSKFTSIATLLNTTKLDDDNIQDNGITASDKIIDGTIPAGKLGTDAIDTINIADDAITAAKLNTPGYGVSVGLTTSNSTTSTTYENLENAGAVALECDITTEGGNVLLIVDGGKFQCSAPTNVLTIQIWRDDATSVIEIPLVTAQAYYPSALIQTIDTGLAAGTYNYKLRWKVSGNTGSAERASASSTMYFKAVELR